MLLRTLGGLALAGCSFGRKKPLVLLAYLALEGPATRRVLGDLLWPDARDPRDSLSSAIRRLRACGSVVATDGDQRLVAAVACDACEFLRSAREDPPESAVRAYGGPFLDGFDVPLGSELEEWVYATRERLAARARQLHLAGARRALALADLSSARAFAENALELRGAPPPEPAEARALLAVLRASGSDRAREFVQDGPFQEEADQGATLTPGPVSHLPNDTTPFLGRERELSDVASALASGARLVTVTGLGGTGKTRLALAVAAELLARGAFDSAHHVPLDSVVRPEEVGDRILSTLGVAAAAGIKVPEAVHLHLGRERVLLVLDNFEHVLAAAGLVADLLAACPQAAILTTSREPLRLVAEWVYRLSGLRLPAVSAAPGEAEQRSAAVDLFEHRAKRSDLTFSITPETLPDVVRVCRLVDGLPLAIELAAPWTRLMSPTDIASEIEASLDLLASSSRNAVERHRRIQACFEASWRNLTAAESEMLTRIAVFRGGFTLEAATTVAGVDRDGLARLVDRSLVRAENSRFDLHPLVMQYAGAKLAARPEDARSLAVRHGHYYVAFAKGCVGSTDELARLDVESANLLAAVERAEAANDAALLIALMRVLAADGAYYRGRGHSPRSMQWLRSAIEAAEASGDDRSAHLMLAKLGDARKLQFGDARGALEAYLRSSELAEKVGDSRRRVLMRSLVGHTRFELGAEAEAESDLELAAQWATDHGDLPGLAHVLQHQGIIAGRRHQWPAARALFRRALDLAESWHGDGPPDMRLFIEYERFMALLNLGEAERMLGDDQRALSTRERALTMAEASGNHLWTVAVTRELGEALLDMGRTQEARRYLLRALRVSQQNHLVLELQRVSQLLAKLPPGEGVPESRP